MSASDRAAVPRPVGGVDLVDLRATSCRWPNGEDPPRYCGADTGGVLVTYCRAHQLLAYKRRPVGQEGAAIPAPAARAAGRVPA